MIILILIVQGLIWGSFVNAFVWRLHEGKNWLSDRSECPHCHHKLAPKDLVPVLSWLLLKGKCRYCHHHIDDSPLVELSVPILFVLSYLWWPLSFSGADLFQFVLWLVFILGFVILAVYDLRWMLLPDTIVYPLIAVGVLQLLTLVLFSDAGWRTVIDAALGVLIISGSFYVLFQVSKGGWIGGGDVKLGVVLGLLAGGPLQACLLLFFASLSGTAYAVPVLVRGKLTPKTVVPFGPFLLLGSIIVRLFGVSIIHWYTHILI
jgi:prepilin signal peptidase PulO-like enzyme (type II secretory pathway)